MEPAVLFFYEENNEKCEQVMDMLDSLGARVVLADVYDDVNLPLVESWNVCCVPTLVFWPSYEEIHGNITLENLKEKLKNNK